MKTRKTFSLLFTFLFVLVMSSKVFAQDPEFTQYYSNPIYLNPALAGSNQCPRVIMNYRNQWGSIKGGPYVTSSVSYDQFASSLNGGIGIIATHDATAQNTLTTTDISAVYSYYQKLSRKWQMAIGFQAGYHQKALDGRNLTFSDQIDIRKGFIYTSKDQLGIEKTSAPDLSAGVVVSNDMLFFGAAVHHLTQPKESFTGISNGGVLTRKYTFHGGAKFVSNYSPYSTQEDYISPNFIYRQQGTFKQFNFGVYLAKGIITGGIWYRHYLPEKDTRDAVNVLIGLRTKNLNIGYSYDITISGLGSSSGGTHELSLAINFACKKKKKKKKFKPLSCPKF